MSFEDYSTEDLQRIANQRTPRNRPSNPSGRSDWRGDWRGASTAALSNAADNLSFGVGDEIMGFGAGALATLGGGDYGQAYAEQVRRSRNNLEQSRYWHPEASLAGSLAGAVAFGGGLGLALRAPRAAMMLRNLNPAQRIGSAALSGGTFGGIYGAGSADYGDLGERAMGGLQGAGIGALMGGAFQGVGMAGMHAFRSAGRTLVPEERAAVELGKTLQREGIDEKELGRRISDLQAMERLSPGSTPMLMDALGDAGTDTVMNAATRPSAQRGAIRDALDQRNMGARDRVTGLLWRELGGNQRRTVANSIEELEEIQKQQAAPLFQRVYQQTVDSVPEPLRRFVEFNSRNNARFNAALEGTRETMRRTMGAEATDAQMMRSPMFWHRLLENSSTEVGAAIRAARVNPLGAPRGSAIADMTQDVKELNGQVRRLLGADFNRAMNIYSGAARNMDAVELGYAAASQTDEMALAQMQRRFQRLSRGEREQAQFAAISRLSSELRRADTGEGRANVLRAIMGNEGKKEALRLLFGGERGFQRVMQALEYEQQLYRNTLQTGIRVNSITADKYFGNQQMFSPEAGTIMGNIRRAFGQEAKEQYDEQLANSVLTMMQTPLTGPNAQNVLQQARSTGLLSRAMREADRRRRFRERVGPLSVSGQAAAAIGLAPE